MRRPAVYVDQAREDAASVGYIDPTWTLLSDAIARSLRTIWWQQRRHGNTLPAQRGIIVIEGGRHGH